MHMIWGAFPRSLCVMMCLIFFMFSFHFFTTENEKMASDVCNSQGKLLANFASLPQSVQSREFRCSHLSKALELNINAADNACIWIESNAVLWFLFHNDSSQYFKSSNQTAVFGSKTSSGLLYHVERNWLAERDNVDRQRSLDPLVLIVNALSISPSSFQQASSITVRRLLKLLHMGRRI